MIFVIVSWLKELNLMVHSVHWFRKCVTEFRSQNSVFHLRSKSSNALLSCFFSTLQDLHLPNQRSWHVWWVWMLHSYLHHRVNSSDRKLVHGREYSYGISNKHCIIYSYFSEYWCRSKLMVETGGLRSQFTGICLIECGFLFLCNDVNFCPVLTLQVQFYRNCRLFFPLW